MSRHFESSASESLSISSAVLTAAPLTMACWFYSYETDGVTERWLMDLHESFAVAFLNCFMMELAPGVVRCFTGDSSSATFADSTRPWYPLQWQHACGVWASTSDRRSFVNGGSRGNETTALTPSGIDRTIIGAQKSLDAAQDFMWGRIAHAAIWNVALEDAEVRMLAMGALPTSIRPFSLQAYWPLNTAAPIDVWNNFHLTKTGTRMAPDPPQLAMLKPLARRLPFQTPSGQLMGQIWM